MKNKFFTHFGKIMLLILFGTILWQTAAGQIATWDMNPLPGGANNFGPSPYAPTTSDPNTTVTGFVRGSGVSTTGTAAARAWGGLAWNYTTAADAVTANAFFTFTVKANLGYSLSLTSINPFDYRRSVTGATSGLVQYQINSGSFVDITTLSFTVSTSAGGSAGPIDLSTITDLQNLPSASTVTFRIVPYAASGSSGTFYVFDKANSTASDFSIIGTVSQADITPPVAAFQPEDGATDVALNTSIIVSFDEAVRNIDASAIDNSNVASLLTLKETDAAGADVPFTATIDATKQVITIVPASDLALSQLYYAAVAPVEDALGNESGISSATFTTTNKDNTSFVDDAGLTQPSGFASSLANTGPNAFPVFKFNIKDAASGDGLPTNLASLTIKFGTSNTANWQVGTDIIGGGFVDESMTTYPFDYDNVVRGTDYITFPVLPGAISIPDGGSKTFILYVFVNTTIADGTVIQVQIDGNDPMISAENSGSQFASTFPSIVGNPITVDVVATQSNFVQQPSNSNVGTPMTPPVTVSATDINGNTDVDFTGDVTITADGATLGGTTTVSAINGVATFNNLIFGTTGTGVVLYADASTFNQTTSSTFDVSPSGVVNIKSNHLNIYPNPVLNNLYISNPAERANIVITNSVGTEILNIRGNTDQKIKIDTDKLQSGIYFVKLTDINGNVFVSKFVKK